MAQTITTELEELLVPLEKLLVGAKKHRGEIEVDYVIPGVASPGDAQDLLQVFGTVTAGHAGPGSELAPDDPGNANDGNGSTLAKYLAGGAGGAIPERWLEGDLGEPFEITHFVVKWTSDFGDLQAELFESGSNDNGRNPYVRFRYWDGADWVEATGAITDDDMNSPRTFTFTFDSPITTQLWQLYTAGKNAFNLWPGYNIYTWGVWGIAETVPGDTIGTAIFKVSSMDLDRSRKTAAAQLVALLDNEDGTRGFYQQATPTFMPNNPIRAFAWYGPRANRVQIYAGILDRDHDHRNPKTVTLKARSRMKWLIEQGFVATAPQAAGEDGAVRTEANGVYVNKTIEYIVEDLLDRAGVPSADRVIETTGITVAEYLLADQGSWLDQIVGTDRLTVAAGRDFWEDELGVFHFERSPLISPTQPTPAWEFAAGVNVLELDHEVDDEERATRAAVSGPMTTSVPAWQEVWSTSKLDHPAGVWYDPSDPDYIRVVDRVTKRIYRIKQSDRTIASSKLLGGYPLGLAGDPTDDSHYFVLNAPWRNTGSTSGNSVKEYDSSTNALLDTHALPNGRWSDLKTDGTNLWLTNYDDGKLYKRSMTATAVDDFTIVYAGVTQDQATGMWMNGTRIGLFFAAHKRFLVVDTSNPEHVITVQSTKGTRIAGGDIDTDTDVDLYAVAGKGSFGLSSGMVAKFTLAELVTNDVGATSTDYDLEDQLGFQSGIADRIHVGCPNDDDPHPYEARLANYSMKVVQSFAQAQAVADAQLALLSRLRRVLDLATVGHPGIQINDPISYTDPIAGMEAVWVVDSYRAQLSGAGTYRQTMSVLPWEIGGIGIPGDEPVEDPELPDPGEIPENPGDGEDLDWDAADGVLAPFVIQIYPNDHPGDDMIEFGTYTAGQVAFGAGYLRLRATRQGDGTWRQGFIATFNIGPSGNPVPTYDYQYASVRWIARAMAGQGSWWSLWSLISTIWGAQEIDGAELIASRIRAYVHGADGSDGPFVDEAPFDAEEWHEYRWDKTATDIVFYLDGDEVGRAEDANMSARMALMADMKIGPPDEAPDGTTPSELYLDIASVKVDLI